MSRDIRSYFCSSKLSAPKKSDTEDKPRKKAKKVILSDEDDDSNPSKSKKAKSGDHTKTKANDNKGRSKKRAILSSDEDENEDTSHGKNKKVKVSSLSKSFNHVEKPVEEIVDPEQVFSKKPVKRINAPTIIKKFSDEQVKQSSASSTKVAYMDDDFDATLNQLDTSQIEDDYLSTITNKNKENGTSEKNTKDEHKSDDEKNGNDVIVSKKKEKDISDIKDKNKSADERISPSNKNKSKEKNHSETKNEKSKEKKDKSYSKKKKKDISNGKLEVEKEAKSNKANDKSKDVDYNDIIQEKIEKKKQHAILYQNYLNRGGARNPGSKKIPKGAEQCLANLTFLITGVLESLEREETEGIIKQYGGKVVHSVSKKLNYLIIGEEAGPSKLAKAANLGIKEISEDDFLDLLRTRPSNVESKKSASSDNNNKRKRDNSSSNDDTKGTETAKKIKEDSSPKNKHRSPHKAEKHKEDLSSKDNHTSPKEIKESKYPSPNHEVSKEISSTQSSKTEEKKANSIIINKISESSTSKIEDKEDNKPFINNLSNKIDDAVDHITALVEKYRPKEMKNIIGQTGDKSNAKKLQFWLTNWHKNHGKDSKVSKPKFSAKDDTGTIYKAALLSGPPGIGKTTTAYVVCTQLGYEVLEFNASDTRSKKLLQEEVSGILSNKTVKSFLTKTVDTKKTPPKHVLLMDEVDGMAGNEDRGGMQELIAFIKSTEVPIICICNDRNSPKIRTLSNYTFDLRFQKPRLEQIRAAMMSICYKEGIKITPEELTQIIHSTNQDIRQVINHIAILSAKSQTKAESAEKLKYKNLKLGPWDVVRKVFSTEEHKNMSIHDKSDLFFHDYNIAALFVEENYPIVTPAGPTAQIYEKLAKCSESLAIGDTIEKNIRSNQAWGLLPVQAIFSSVIPGSVMSGYLNSQINFPSWLGRNSKSSKCDRLLQDITVHARITTGASKEAINLDYLKMLVDSIVRPLAIEGTEGVDKAVDIMNKYHLSREDLDSLIELTKWPHTRDPMQAVDSKTKTAFTKAYNKSSSFSSAGTMKKKSTRDLQGNGLDGSDEEQLLDDNEDNEKIENDKLIKAKASKAKSAPSGSKSKAKTVKNTASHSKKNN